MWFFALVLVLFLPEAVQAQGRAKMAREAAELLISQGGSKAGKSVTHLARRIEGIAAKHGDESILALRKGGPEAVHLVEAAGENGGKAIRCLATHGEAGATRVLSRPTAMKQFLTHGDDCARVLVAHPGVAEPLIERGGIHAVHALGAVTPQSGRRLAIVLEGELAENLAKHPELLGVVAKHGDSAVDFIWRNKAVLAGGAALAAFVANPEPYLKGSADLAAVAGESVAKPVIAGASSAFNTTLIVGGVIALVVISLVIGLAYKHGLPKPETVKEALGLFRKSEKP